MDASADDIHYIQSDKIYWQYDLQAKESWISRENINSLLTGSGFPEDLGLLSIDVNGNDYWIWEAVQSVKPRIVVVEYNSLLGLEPICVPYWEDFDRTAAHYSNLYYGCSIGALHHLATSKGYILLGSNIWGHNAFFVRSDIAGPFKGLEPQQAYVRHKFRDLRRARGPDFSARRCPCQRNWPSTGSQCCHRKAGGPERDTGHEVIGGESFQYGE